MKYKEIKRCNNCRYARFITDEYEGDWLQCSDVGRPINVADLRSDCYDHKLKDGAKRLYEEV